MKKLATLIGVSLLLCVLTNAQRSFQPNVQKRQSIYTGDDPHGLKVVGMPKARHKYSIIDLPSGTEVPAEYSTCGNGVYYQKERVRGIDFTAVMVHFKAEGDIDLTGDPPDPSKPRFKAGFETYVPQGWVALTFTLLRDSFTIQEIRLIRAFPRRPIPGTCLEYGSILVDPLVVRVDRSWVGKDPYVTWENSARKPTQSPDLSHQIA